MHSLVKEEETLGRGTKTVDFYRRDRCSKRGETEGMRARMVAHADNINSTQTTYVLIDVKKCCHDGILDGSQIRLVPVDVEHSSYTMATAGVTGHVLQ